MRGGREGGLERRRREAGWRRWQWKRWAAEGDTGECVGSASSTDRGEHHRSELEAWRLSVGVDTQTDMIELRA